MQRVPGGVQKRYEGRVDSMHQDDAHEVSVTVFRSRVGDITPGTLAMPIDVYKSLL